MYDKLIKLKNKLEKELNALEFRMNQDSRPVNPDRNVRRVSDVNKVIEPGSEQNLPSTLVAYDSICEADTLKLSESLKREHFEKESLLALYNGQSVELESLKLTLKEREDQFSCMKEKVQKNEKNMAIFISNLGKRIHMLEKENHLLQSKNSEQSKGNLAFVDEIKFLKSEIISHQKKEIAQHETEIGLFNKISEKEEETAVLFSRINKMEAERSKLIEEMRRINIENALKEEFKKHHRNKSLAHKLVRWLGSPLLDFNPGKN